MESNRSIHEKYIKQVADALGELNEKVVYVGGAVTALYFDEKVTREIRPTMDVDITFQIVSLGELENLRKELVKRGFSQSQDHDVICRFNLNDLVVDVMSTKSVGWAPSNQWFQPGFNHKKTKNIDGVGISILSLPYYLATKLTAYKNRGENPFVSHDFEDIVRLFDHVSTIGNDIHESPSDVKVFLKKEIGRIFDDKEHRLAISSHLGYRTGAERLKIIEKRLAPVLH